MSIFQDGVGLGGKFNGHKEIFEIGALGLPQNID